MAGHTPGPWTTDKIMMPKNRRWCQTHVLSGRKCVAIVHASEGTDVSDADVETIKANAALIAASPDLLAACQWMLRALKPFVEAEGEEDDVCESARAAIAKATTT